MIPKGSKDRAQWLQWWAKSERSLAAWQSLGVRTIEGKALPQRDIKAALVMPDDKQGRVYLAYQQLPNADALEPLLLFCHQRRLSGGLNSS